MSLTLLPIQIIKAHTRRRESQINRSRWTIALLRNNQLGDVLLIFRQRIALLRRLVLLLAIDERHHVRILFQRT